MSFKKSLSYVLSGLIFFSATTVSFNSTENVSFSNSTESSKDAQSEQNNSDNKQTKNSELDGIAANSYVLMDYESGKILAEKKADEKRQIASINKVMTMFLIAEKIDEDQKKNVAESEKYSNHFVTISENAKKSYGSKCFFEVGEKITVFDLFKAVCLHSANDAAIALAEDFAGSEQKFVELMNKKAKELGLKNTEYRNSTGLDDKEEDVGFSTARDIATLTKIFIDKFSWILKYTSKYEDTILNGTKKINNTNKLLYYFDGTTKKLNLKGNEIKIPMKCVGFKTGTTDKAGCCLDSVAEYDGVRLIAVALGCMKTADATPSENRFKCCAKLLSYGFSNFKPIDLDFSSVKIDAIKVNGGEKLYAEPMIDWKADLKILIPKGNSKISYRFIPVADLIKAPIVKGQLLGKIEALVDGEVYAEKNVVAKEEIKKLTYVGVFKKLFLNLFTGV